MLLQQIINGITIGSTYALVAIGFTMIFGVLELTNFSNSSLYMFGAYITYLLYSIVGARFFLAFTISIVLTGVLGYGVDRFALRRLRKKRAPKLSGLITTLGMSMVIDNSVMVFFGTDSKSFTNFMDFGKFYVGNAVVTWTQVIILSVACILMITLSIIVYRTKIGKAMGAIAQNQDAARLMGINTNKVISFTFIVSGFLACVAGTMVAMYYRSIETSMGTSIGTKIFAAAILGGVGILPGAVVGGLVLGVVETMVSAYISTGYRDAISFTILILVLLIMPNGLFGKKAVNKV
ncbi:branched-chain amino acid ABC transporter permease [Parasphaerochaeta coccoides]|uniref:Inner-membrane translocator n=1 Tax=Parasphaerochaeta coccoides (strain ATCC BAA-1237 / DSM 17374 / SPN1) TaxID=760011 RepID=F4GJ55_PARC1|nr:branched-chain amino acid ABC transporter permease [Parasphaerochaeta coccoides]AEC01350.1 inner-membrane translocator [Parasphaerochaeta coccoides DSM 17374]